ncbi:MAG: Amuc_1101 family PilM-like pilus complex protein [Luteolibacter sp.]|uniref:Amuc_1101 family PilM-like pilus complex protein n=1 Tax=Luteolibacter sp. TaxID=1962973 RepID=UPI0032669CA9
MAENQTTVALNIGSQRIGMAVFEASKNGTLILKAYDSETIVADPALDSSRISQSRVAIADLANRLKVGGSKVRYAISGQSVFTRFVKLPPLQEDNIEQLVTFEAQQHVPFPLAEVVWDYELIEGADEKEVVIVAIKADALDEVNSAVNDAALGTSEVDVAPMAIYNAFRATYGNPEEPILLIDIGAKTSNLLYIEGRRFFTRSIAIGGGAVTAAIAKEYGIPFMEAEHQKISNGLVALGGGHTEQMDESVAALAMVIRNALTRLPAEIARTTNYYRAQHGGSAPRRILLAGGGANLPYTLEFFQEKLNLPVEYFNPVGNVTIGKGVDSAVVQREGHLMGELVGLGLRGIGKSVINIDLVPGVVEQSRAADRRKPFLIGTAAVLLGGMLVWAVFQNLAASAAKEYKTKMEDQRTALEPIKGEIDQLLKNEAALNKIASGYTNAESDHAFWMDLLSEVRGAFASDAVWVTDLEPLYGYDPLAESGEAGRPNAKPKSGQSLIKAEFFAAAYGTSSLSDMKIEAPAPAAGKKGQAQPVQAVALAANAVRIKGFWRETPKSQNVVSELLKNLRDKSNSSSSFRFKVKNPKGGDDIILPDDRILDITVAGKPGELGFPFEITLPLARDVIAK